MAFGVLQDFIKSFMDVQLGEYVVEDVTKHLALPLRVAPQRRAPRGDSVNQEKNSQENKPMKYKAALQVRQEQEKEQLQKKLHVAEAKQRPLNLKTRITIKQMKEEDRKLAEEVAYVLEDILHAVDKNYTKVFRLG